MDTVVKETVPAQAPKGSEAQGADVKPEKVVVLKRRAIDSILIGFGVVAVAVFAIAGGLLTWGHNFDNDYVHKELASQHVVFPSAEALTTEGRTDLLGHAGHAVTSGSEAQAYASYIDGHLQKIANGATYADLGAPQNAAKAAVTDAKAKNASAEDIAKLQATVDTITGQRTSLFQGETLRGLLLSAYAWSTVGTIAGYAAIGAFAAAVLMLILVALGFVHHMRTAKA